MKTLVNHIVRFIGLILLQVLVLNHIGFLGRFTPYLYLYILLVLPMDMNRSVVLLLAFCTGMVMDIFSNTAGMHTSACLLLAFIRPAVLGYQNSREQFEGTRPGIITLGLKGFVSYVMILVLVHHILLLWLEVFTWTGVFSILFRALFNALLTGGLIIAVEVIFAKSPVRR
ncbi:MAG: rod shape-determining protein MreD [Flavobacteriales bacterium]|nr:rod shape-determining protein MreD [Flavobacteriales bacterium]MCB9449168.1 rod shape-determining protein MreD [Flavobacteriales bacterium]